MEDRVKIERVNNKPCVTIEQFAEEHDLVIVIHFPNDARPLGFRHKFQASFRGCEVVENEFLVGVSGWGVTEEDAINEYAKQISRKTIRLEFNKRIDVPELAVRVFPTPLEQYPIRQPITP